MDITPEKSRKVWSSKHRTNTGASSIATIMMNNAITTIKDYANKFSHFKIGKTGQKLSDRFDSEYKAEYNSIICIYNNTNSDIIDKLEKVLINHFQNNDDYKHMCDNDAVGGGNMDESAMYQVYIVVG